MNRRLLLSVGLLTLCAPAVLASPMITLAEVVALFPDYANHEEQIGFQAPCVDAAGTLVLHVNVNDILGTVTEPIAVAMVCQQIGLPPFTALGPVSFSNPGIELMSFGTVPGHPDAFQIEYIVPLGAGVFDITIQNTGWPEGCLTEMLDWAAWDLISVPTDESRFGQVKALYQ